MAHDRDRTRRRGHDRAVDGVRDATIIRLARIFELLEPLRERVAAGMPAFGTCAGMILLADRIDLLRDTNLVGVYADDVFVTVVIEERQIIAGTHRLMMMFGAKDMQLKQWTVTDPQGYDTTIAVYNLDTTKRPDPNLFRIDYTRDIK